MLRPKVSKMLKLHISKYTSKGGVRVALNPLKFETPYFTHLQIFKNTRDYPPKGKNLGRYCIKSTIIITNIFILQAWYKKPVNDSITDRITDRKIDIPECL